MNVQSNLETIVNLIDVLLAERSVKTPDKDEVYLTYH